MTSPAAPVGETLLALSLLAACVSDVATRKIPNALCALTLAGGALAAVQAGGWEGLLPALAACGRAAGLALALYAARIVAPGDVKFFTASCAFLPPGNVVPALLLALSFGGVLAGLILSGEVAGRALRLSRGRHSPPASHPMSHLWTQVCALMWTQAQATLAARRRAPQAATTVPYAVALAVGVWAERTGG